MAAAPADARARPYLLGSRITLEWTNPPASAFAGGPPQSGVRVVRRERAFPLAPDDGELVYDGPVVASVTDDHLEPGTRYYYTVFAHDGAQYLTSDDARAQALATGYPDLPERLYRMLPAVHQRDDRPLRPDEVAALPAPVAAALAALPLGLRGTGPLRRFLEAALAPLALARSTAEGLRQLRNVELVPPPFLPLAGSFVDLTTDRSLPLARQRSELRDAARLLRTTGTVPHLRATVTRTTRWQARVAEYVQNIAREGAAAQGNLFARRPGTPWWTAADDVSAVLGFGPGNTTATGSGLAAAVLAGTVPGPFALRAGTELSTAVDGMLPVTVRLTAADAVDLAAATAAEVAAVLDRRMPEVSAVARADGRLELRSPGGVPSSTLTVERPEATLVSLEGAPRGRLAVAGFASPFGTRVAHAETVDGVPRLRCRALRAGSWCPSSALLGEPARPVVPQADPALVALPPAVAGDPPRCLAVWVERPGTASARLRWARGVLRRPRPAVLVGERSSPLGVADGSWLVLRDGRGRRRGARLVAADFAVPSAPTAAEVVAVLSARLGGFALVDVAPGGRVRLTSPTEGDDAVLTVDLADSTAAGALGFDVASGSARGRWDDEIDWGPVQDVAGLAWLAEPAVVAVAGGGAVLAYARHDGGSWQVRVVTWDGAVWSGDTLLSAAGAGAREPSVAVDGGGRVWVAWAGRAAAGQPWTLRRRSRDPVTGTWDAEAALVPGGPGPAGDREPALDAAGGGTPAVVFRSDRAGGSHLWRAVPPAPPQQLTSGAAADSWPALVAAPGGPWLLHRSDRSVPLAAAGRGGGADTGTLRRYAGSVTIVPGDLARLNGRGGWDDLLAYTPHRPQGATWQAPLRDDEPYTRGAVGLYLTQVASGPLDVATADRLRSVLPRIVPANVRVLVRLAPGIDVEELYPAGADLMDEFADVHPDIDYLGAVTETTAVTTGWSLLRAAVLSVPAPADPEAGGSSAEAADLTSLRSRTWSPPPQ